MYQWSCIGIYTKRIINLIFEKKLVKKLIRKPQRFFFGCIPIFLLIAILSGDRSISVHLFDLYFMLSIRSISLFSSYLFLLIGLDYSVLYWIERPPQKTLSALHIFLQIIVIIPYLIAVYFTYKNVDLTDHPLFPFVDFNTVLLLSFTVFLVSILVHLLNFLISIFVKK